MSQARVLQLLREQLARDRKRTRYFPALYTQKVSRMRASPLGLLRGTAPMFYAMLRAFPDLARGPDATGWITGDLHFENFGAFRCSRPGSADDKVVFDLNDFDDATRGPARFDLLRLTTSLVLAVRAIGEDGTRAASLADALIDAYLAALKSAEAPAMPSSITALVNKAQSRTRKELLDARTTVVGDSRKFTRGPRYSDVSARLRSAALKAFHGFARTLDVDVDHMTVLDMAFRVAGTGSLGAIRIAVLVSGKGGVDGAWIFDMKEQGTPSSSSLAKPPRGRPADRVIQAMDACLASPPRMIGATEMGAGISMLVRRLAPQEDKLDIAKVGKGELEAVARYLGALAGRAHRRGGARPGRGWTAAERARVLDRATVLAGMHETAYLAMCGWTRQGVSSKKTARNDD